MNSQQREWLLYATSLKEKSRLQWVKPVSSSAEMMICNAKKLIVALLQVLSSMECHSGLQMKREFSAVECSASFQIF